MTLSKIPIAEPVRQMKVWKYVDVSLMCSSLSHSFSLSLSLGPWIYLCISIFLSNNQSINLFSLLESIMFVESTWRDATRLEKKIGAFLRNDAHTTQVANINCEFQNKWERDCVCVWKSVLFSNKKKVLKARSVCF